MSLPRLPARLEGCTILHLSDFHIRRFRPYFRDLIEQCERETPDFVFMTGDYMTFPGDEEAALHVMSELINVIAPNVRHGIYASFGNHDYSAFRKWAPRRIPNVTWLVNNAHVLHDLQLTIVGTSTPCDVTDALVEARQLERASEKAGSTNDAETEYYRILLGHEPTVLMTAADLGIEWVLAGHTHGGQIRIGPRIAMHTSCNLPPRFASGILRLRDSVCTISRGLGSAYFDVRFCCPSQVILYELNQGPLPGDADSAYEQLTCVEWW